MAGSDDGMSAGATDPDEVVAFFAARNRTVLTFLGFSATGYERPSAGRGRKLDPRAVRSRNDHRQQRRHVGRDPQKARQLSDEVLETCAQARADADTDEWLDATEGEALLIQGKAAEALVMYRRFVKAGKKPWQMTSTFLNAQLLLLCHKLLYFLSVLGQRLATPIVTSLFASPRRGSCCRWSRRVSSQSPRVSILVR